MNRIERLVYNLVKHKPRLKLAVRDVYQWAFSLLPPPPSKTAYPLTAREGFFFGFHDHTPFSADGSMLLGCRYVIPLRMPLPTEEVEVGYFDGPELTAFNPAARSQAWNWQMGCKLQWRGEDNDIIFNDHVDGTITARCVNVKSGKGTILPAAVGSVSPDGRWAVGYSFVRVERYMPGYGYPYQLGEPELDSPAPTRSGLHLIDLKTLDLRRLFSITDLLEVEPTRSMRGSSHFVTHTVFSPDSQRFIFLHRWVRGDVHRRWSRMISSDLEGCNLHVFPTQEMVSHIGWRDSEHVIAYCRDSSGRDRYVLFRDRDPANWQHVGAETLLSDGHPSFEPSGRWMLTDTYPNRRRMQRLILFDMHGARPYDLALLHSPPQYRVSSAHRDWACDLHPRWNRAGTMICFDSTHTGPRSLATIRLSGHPSIERPRGLS